ncbi:unnamed protein product [Schistosoma margrebowiei]|uniref:Uncharacterized protein n=1 Tax=Schistosoma margrebowiei TaxID=48269 RepID=A0A183N0H7_9TREM|nr:unnamed protein product [Schistosoma margrebowiei]
MKLVDANFNLTYLGPWYENQPKTGNLNNSDMNNNTNNINDDTCEKLLEGIAEAKTTIDLFLNNRFEEAKNRLHMNTHSGMYQELSNSTILFIQGMATIEQENLETAKEQLKTTLKACQANRRKAAISETFTKQIEKSRNIIYSLYTDGKYPRNYPIKPNAILGLEHGVIFLLVSTYLTCHFPTGQYCTMLFYIL